MKIIHLALSAVVSAGAGCATAPSSPQIAISELPNCFESNYDAQRRLFTIRDLNDIWADPTKNPSNRQCLLTVGPSASAASTARLTAGTYIVYLANGGGGGEGGRTGWKAGASGGSIPVVSSRTANLRIDAGTPRWMRNAFD